MNNHREIRQAAAFTLLLLSLPMLSMASTITVNSASDVAADDGLCTLREAIAAANTNIASGISPSECQAGATSGTDHVVFAIPGAGPHVIQVGSALPDLSSPISLDGYSQPGAAPNTLAGVTEGFNADIRIVIDGSQSGTASKPGLWVKGVDAVGVVIRGLEIRSFTSSGCCADSGIAVGNGAQNLQIAGNVIHHNKSRGVIALSNNNSILNLLVGGPNAEDRNVIYANQTSAGVSINNCTTCRVENNWIGLHPDNGQPVAAGNMTGVELGAIGATIVGNWIAGNTLIGVRVANSSTQNLVTDNVIGGGIANAIGILLENVNNSFPGQNTIAANHIHDNTGAGIALRTYNSTTTMKGNVFQGNFLGDNGGVEIDIGTNGLGTLDGITANDAGDTDDGPNGIQNFPVIGSPTITNGQASIPYDIDSPIGNYALEFSFSTTCDVSGHGPSGDMPAAPIRIDALPKTGTAVFPINAIPETGYISATATGSDGTSEFSACQPYVKNDAIFNDGFGD